MSDFEQQVHLRATGNAANERLRIAAKEFMEQSIAAKYSYNFFALGRPIIQYPQDIVALQEIIWKVKPDLIIETGIAHGGSLVLNASMLALLDYCDAVEERSVVDPARPHRKVIGVDIDIREANKEAIAAHQMSSRIEMMQGSSIDPDIVASIRQRASAATCVLVCLDSNHTHEHVLEELSAYAPLVTPGSYCIVFDSIVEDLPPGGFPDRPWDKGNNPKTAIWAFLRAVAEKRVRAQDGTALKFEIDKSIESKLLLTVAPDGYLKRVI